LAGIELTLEPGLAGMTALPGHGVEEQRARGDDLAVMIRVGEAHEQAPPVVDQRHHAGHQPAWAQAAIGR
jgi:hypothetical protein